MQPLEEQEDPSFASVEEPAQLQRPHCDQCLVAIADYECLRCAELLCIKCELVIHHRLEDLALKCEESKGDGRPHQECLKWISACQNCGEKNMEFFCLNCNMYQCENCCATKHRQHERHFYFCVEGSSPKMLPFASWNLMFVEMVKMSKGDLQDSIATTDGEMTLAPRSARMIPKAKHSTSFEAHVKLEQVVRTNTANATTAALGNLTIAPEKTAVLPVGQTHTTQSKRASQKNTTSMIDLTLDGESNDMSRCASSRPSAEPRIKEETQVKTEDAWLTSAITAPENPVCDVDVLMENSMGEDEDPVLRFMTNEYNQLSAKIFSIEQECDRVRTKTKALSSSQPIDIQEVNKTRARANKLRKEKAELEKARDGVVANVVFYVKSDPEELKEFLRTCTAEVSYAQAACHRQCAAIEASIRQNLETIRRIQHDVEELIKMKKDAFAEITRLGAEIAQGEEEVRKLDKERQNEFLRLCQFSKSIQTAVQKMAAST